MLKNEKLSIKKVYDLVIALLCCLIAICGFSMLVNSTTNAQNIAQAESETDLIEDSNYLLRFSGLDSEKPCRQALKQLSLR